MRREARRSFDKRDPVVILALSMMKFYRFHKTRSSSIPALLRQHGGDFYVNRAKPILLLKDIARQ